MKLKKFASLLLALVMMLALATPAFAVDSVGPTVTAAAATEKVKVDKIENGKDANGNEVINPNKTAIEEGAPIDTQGYKEIYIKQSTDVFIWVPSSDTRSDEEIIRTACINDKSLEKDSQGGTTTVVRGVNTGYVMLHNDTRVWVTAEGMLTVLGTISHASFVGGVKPDGLIPPQEKPVSPKDPWDPNGKTSTAVTFYKYVDVFNATTDEAFSFKFYRIDGDTRTEISATGPVIAEGVYTYNFEPALEDGSYVIEEVLTADQANRYVEGKTLEFTVENGEADFGENDPSITNETKTVVEFAKTVDGAVPTEDFRFDLYQGDAQIKADAFTASEDHDTYTATFSPKLDDGVYTIKEVLTDDQVGQYVDGKTLSFTVENGVVVAGDTAFAIDNEQKGFIDVTTPTVMQKYIKQVHENEYRLYEEGTLVSHVASVSGAELPDGITGNYLKNGMTYLTIDKAKLAAAGENGVTIGIAQSDPQKGNKKSWNTPAPAPLGENNQPSYNLKIEDGKLVVTSELPNIGVRLYSAKESPKGPSDFKGSFATKGHLTGVTTATFDIPKGDTFKFFLHVEDTSYYTNEIIGCKLVSSEVLEQAYNCELTTVVTDTDGNVMSDYTNGLLPGTYTVTVTATVNGVVKGTWSEPVEVQPGETTFVDFGTQYVEEMGEPVIDCPQNCGTIKLIPLTPAEPVEP